MKKKTLEEREGELRQLIGELLKAKEQEFALRVLLHSGTPFDDNQKRELDDLTVDIEMYCKRIGRVKGIIKKLKKEQLTVLALSQSQQRRLGIQLR